MKINGREIACLSRSRDGLAGRFRADGQFKRVGTDVLIGDVNIYGDPDAIRIGSHVRIDDFTLIVVGDGGALDIGDYCHIGPHCSLHCHGGVTLDDFVAISAGCHLYSATDRYDGESMTGPTVPARFRDPDVGPIRIQQNSIVGAGTVIGPNCTIREGVAVGGQSLVTRSLEPWGIYGGVPAKLLRKRSKALLGRWTELMMEGVSE